MAEDMFAFHDEDKKKHSEPKKRVPRRNVWITILVATVLFVYDVFKTVSMVLGVAFMIRFFLIQPFYVSGDSMLPNFQNNQYIIVDQVTYKVSKPRRGDVIVFKWPQNTAVSFIKRIIGTPGETVEVRDGKVYITNASFPSGTLLNEPYIKTSTITNVRRALGKNEYFVMGDNRHNSSDSRSWGPLARHLIIGKVWLVVYPFSDFEAVHRVGYAKGL